MSTKWLIAGGAGCFVVGTLVGGGALHTWGEHKINKLIEEHQAAVAMAQDKADRELLAVKTANEETLKAYEEEKLALARTNRQLSANARRMRLQLEGRAGRGAGNTGGADGTQGGGRIGSCERLLGEGAELLAEGTGLLGRLSNRADALTKWKQ